MTTAHLKTPLFRINSVSQHKKCNINSLTTCLCNKFYEFFIHSLWSSISCAQLLDLTVFFLQTFNVSLVYHYILHLPLRNLYTFYFLPNNHSYPICTNNNNNKKAHM